MKDVRVLQKSLFIVELTVPREAAVGQAFKRKRLRYYDLAAKAGRTQLVPTEVGFRGFTATSTTRLLVRSQRLLSEAATGCG